MELFWVALAAFGASMLTFFSGFGLGTLLLPVLVLFFPVEWAVALTGVVHFFNGLFKLLLVGRQTDLRTLTAFGIPAVLAALLGSWLLLGLGELQPLYAYTWGGRRYEVATVQFVVACLLLVFAIADLLPVPGGLRIGRRQLPIGGLLSGFFGGLSGHQGALRSAFLIKAGLSKETYIATGVAIACCIDLTRLAVYATRFDTSGLQAQLGLVFTATLAAMAGAIGGNRLLKKLTLDYLRRLVAVLLIAMAVAMGAGWV
ncbi:MAG: sulfite exporter TauE/SafE family protein [Bacteroidia bacterium]